MLTKPNIFVQQRWAEVEESDSFIIELHTRDVPKYQTFNCIEAVALTCADHCSGVIQRIRFGINVLLAETITRRIYKVIHFQEVSMSVLKIQVPFLQLKLTHTVYIFDNYCQFLNSKSAEIINSNVLMIQHQYVLFSFPVGQADAGDKVADNFKQDWFRIIWDSLKPSYRKTLSKTM